MLPRSCTALPIMGINGALDDLFYEKLSYADLQKSWSLSEHASFMHKLQWDKKLDITTISSADLHKEIAKLDTELRSTRLGRDNTNSTMDQASSGTV